MSITVKKLFYEVPEYDFSDEQKVVFVGRLEEQERLKRKISPPCLNLDVVDIENANYKGCYLVAGYRGIGKSTLVEKVSKEIGDKVQGKNKSLHKIKVYLSQGDLSDYDLLSQMFIQLNDAISDGLSQRRGRLKIISASLTFLITLLFFGISNGALDDFKSYLGYEFIKSRFVWRYDPKILENEVLVIIILTCFSILVYSLLLRSFQWLLRKSENIKTLLNLKDLEKSLIEKSKKTKKRFHPYSLLLYSFQYLKRKSKHDEKSLIARLEKTEKRIHSNLEVSNSPTGQGHNRLETTFIQKIADSFSSKDSSKQFKQAYDKISVKELEFEIKEILSSYKKLNKGYVLFIVDELDRLEPEFNYGTTNDIDLGKSKVQNRKDSVAKLLANLKSFIHTADAKFIFIGGAEMYDASLADIADRESFYSSIFHEVIYVNSFFKDWIAQRKGLSQMTEDYLVRNLLPNKHKIHKLELQEINRYSNSINQIDENDLSQQEKFFAIYQLRKFIIFLTYRSNGSPRRLKEIFESYLLQPSDYVQDREKGKQIITLEYSSNNQNCIRRSEAPLKTDKTYLKLGYHDQYHIGLVYSIASPFLLKNQKYLKYFSDRNLYLSAFLFDHILKYHRSAFSWRHLELLPDIILGSKGPNLREMLKLLITSLSERHYIRETSNAMFQYKFRSRAAMEFRYISKISDSNAAAYNFTYDESYHLKSFFKQKLKQKRISSKIGATADDDLSSTISYLNSIIAELHYYDEEYESAIRYYNDSFEPIQKSLNELSNEQKVKFLTNRLMLSLCQEKTYDYDTTYATLRNLIFATKKWKFNAAEEQNKKWETPFKRKQLFLRPHVALLTTIEKGRSDGITESNLSRNIYEYTEFMGLKDLFPSEAFIPNLGYRDFINDNNTPGDHKRIQTLLADYYQHVGSILFFKNRNFNSVHQKGAFGVWYQFMKIENFDKSEKELKQIQEKDLEAELGKISVDSSDKTNFEVYGLQYTSIRKIREYQKHKSRYFFPAYSATFYYVTAIGHLLLPYQDNLNKIFADNTIDFTPFQLENEELTSSQSHIDSENQKVVVKRITNNVNEFISHFNSQSSVLRMFHSIETMLYDKNALHLLSGKTAQTLGMVLSKQSDTILACLGNSDCFSNSISDVKSIQINKQGEIDILSNERKVNYWYRFWQLTNETNMNSIAFDKYFSIANVFYHNIISYRCFELAGLYNDALFQLKKSIDILKTYGKSFLTEDEKTKIEAKQFIQVFSEWLKEKALICINSFGNNEEKIEIDYLKNITSNNLDEVINQEFEISRDLREINYLLNHTYLKIEVYEEDFIKKQLENLEVQPKIVDNIYNRIQELRYTSYLFYKRFKLWMNPESKIFTKKVRFANRRKNLLLTNSLGEKIYADLLIKDINNWHRLYHNLLKISNTYGISYILGYSSLGNLHFHIYQFLKFYARVRPILENVKDEYFDEIGNSDTIIKSPEYHQNEAIDNLIKAVNLHSEGLEYKTMIKNMYILEDDYNDLLVHFCAALERSLVNTGVIEKKLEKLNFKV